MAQQQNIGCLGAGFLFIAFLLLLSLFNEKPKPSAVPTPSVPVTKADPAVDVEQSRREATYDYNRELAARNPMFVVTKSTLRREPNAKAAEAGTVGAGEIVHVGEESGEWRHVYVDSNLDGWMRIGALEHGSPTLRSEFAKTYERALLDGYQEATVRSTGHRGQTLRVEIPIVTKVLAHHFGKNIPAEDMRQMGFTKIVLTDDDMIYTWTIK